MTTRKDDHAEPADADRITVDPPAPRSSSAASSRIGETPSQQPVNPVEGPPPATTDVVLTDANRVAFVDYTVQGAADFRIFANGQFFEQVGDKDGKKLYAPSL